MLKLKLKRRILDILVLNKKIQEEKMIKGIKKMLYVATASLMMAAPLNAAGNNNELICIDPGHQVRGNSALEEIISLR